MSGLGTPRIVASGANTPDTAGAGSGTLPLRRRYLDLQTGGTERKQSVEESPERFGEDEAGL